MLLDHDQDYSNILLDRQHHISTDLAHPHGMDAKARQALSTNLRRLMEINGWKQGSLARKSGVAQTTISYIVRGEERSVGIDAVDKLAHALGVPAWTLLADLGDEVSKDAAKQLDRLMHAYAKLPETGRRMVDRVAEAEARYARVA